MPADQDALRIANESGFPLQIAIKRQVKDTQPTHGWSVRYSEHAWANRIDGGQGFIDLVLQDEHRTTLLVVECKRVRESTWLFLSHDGRPAMSYKTKAWVSLYQAGTMQYYGWVDVAVDPKSAEAHFCALRGQTSGDRITLLERVGGELVSATEALAAEERDYRSENMGNIKIYLNVIVTTADLKVAKFDASTISLADGTLAEADFESVPYVRLRKQLSTRVVAFTPTDHRNVVDIAASKEHTIFVVRADAVPAFLVDLEVDSSSLRKLSNG